MNASNDFSPRRPIHDRVDVGELIGERERVDAATDECAPVHPQSSMRGRTLAFVALVLLAVVAAALLASLIALPLGWREQAVAGSLLIIGALVIARRGASPSATMALMTLSLFVTLRYLYWRTAQTWQGLTSGGHLREWDALFMLLLLGAELYALTTLALNYFQTLRPLHRPPAPLAGPSDRWPTIDVFIPTCREPLESVRPTVLGALALDYPPEKINVFVLDDAHRQMCEQWATQVGAGYISRSGTSGGRAGSINDALARTHGDLVVVFDPQHIPTRSFLATTVGWFVRDPRLGLVQTPHHFYAPDPFERNLGERTLANESALFHRLVQDGSDLWNAAVFCGSCAILRRLALLESGGIPTETESEDTHTALRMQCRGWNTAYLDHAQPGGLATESLSAHIAQRIRRARGMLAIVRLENPLGARGLSFAQRLCYFTSATRFLFAWPRLIFLTVPLVYLLFGMVIIYGDARTVIAYAAPHLFLAHVTNARIQRGVRPAFWNHIYEAVLTPYLLLPTLKALINPRRRQVDASATSRVVERAYFDHRSALPLIVLLGLNIAALPVAYHRFGAEPAHQAMLVLSTLWTAYNILILSVAASVARERQQRRHDVRVDARVPLTLAIPGGRPFTGVTSQLSRSGTTAWFGTPIELRGESEVTLRLSWQGDQCDFESHIVSIRGNREIHLLFPHLSARQERFLVEAIYARPETWVTRNTVEESSSLTSLLHIVRLSVRGLAIVIAGLVSSVRMLVHAAGRGARSRKRTQTATVSMLALTLSLPAQGRAETRRHQSVHPVVFATAPHPDEVKAAAIVASWFSLLSDGREMRFPVGIGELPQGHAVVLARRGSAIESLLSLPAEPHTLVAIRDNPRDIYGKLLVIAGDRPADFVTAASALVRQDLSQLVSDVFPVSGAGPGVAAAKRAFDDAPRWASSRQPTPFSSFTTAEQLTVTGSGSIDLPFRVPPDLYFAARQSVPLRLRFAYETDSRAALRVLLNAHEVDTLPLKPSSVAVKREVVVRVPTDLLRLYANTLTFHFDGGAGDASPAHARFAAIQTDSSIDLSGLPHSVGLPQLGLLVEAGYPFTAHPDLSGTAIVLSNRPTTTEFETVLNMAGFVGAQTGAATTGVAVVDADHVGEVRDRNLLVLGTPATQPLLSMWSSFMPLELTRGGPALNDAAKSTSWLHPTWPFRDSDRERLARLIGAGYTFDAVLEQFASPYRSDRSVVVIVPGDDAGVFAASTFSAARNGAVEGGVAVGRNGRFESFRLGVGTFESGDASIYQRARMLLLERYWLIAPLVLLCALLIGRVVNVATERLAARRLAGTS